MKKNLTIIGITILSLVLTFFFTEIMSIYHFGTIPTLLTTLYLISMFSIIEYLLLSIYYIVKKLIKKEKLNKKIIISLVLLFISLLLILGYILILDIDYLHWYMYSSPFYLNVIVRSLEFLLPAIILIIISIILIKKSKQYEK
ncbi:MAG: hypothetical protein IJE53_00265 [Bacilli bacterium]|nr:hypothetical protein [Bacilli bacterium]